MPTNLNAMSFGGFGNFGGFGGYGDFANSVSAMAFKVLKDDAPQLNQPTRERRATASTSVPVPKMEVKELPSGALVLAVDVPAGVSPADVRVQVEDGNVLVITGECEHPAAAEATGKFERIRYPPPESADLDSIRAEYRDGVLSVTVEKLPPPGTKKPRIVEVKISAVGDERGSA
ncbi:hypothetical protein VPH35_116729 [Triticum aestivum]